MLLHSRVQMIIIDQYLQTKLV